MDKEEVIKIQNISKIYKLYEKPIDRLKESVNIFAKKYHEDFYALKNISFNITKGETIGLIGKNGSGKSTLLKIITGVLTPTNGSIQINGKISALLELGAGFNMEFTGIENIFLNGTIMGFTKEEIDKKLDAILAFADIGDFVYQPVKMYSSGMFVRLAFAVQACIEPEILIVDEALAVGDAEFSFKCINHMKRLVEKGVTVIFVTHDVQTVRSFCQRVVWLDKGEVKLIGEPHSVTTEYVRYLFGSEIVGRGESEEIDACESNELKDNHDEKLERWGNGKIRIINYSLVDEKGEEADAFEWGKKIIVKVTAKVSKKIDSKNVGFGFSFRNRNGLDIIVSTTLEEGLKLGPFKEKDQINVEFEFENILAPGDYLLTLQVEDRTMGEPQYYEFIENAKVFCVLAEKQFYSIVQPQIIQKINIIGEKQ